FLVVGEHGVFAIELAEGFSGAFDSVTATTVDGALSLQGADESGKATGVDARAVINGQAATGDGRSFIVEGAGVRVKLELSDDHVGPLHDITIAPQRRGSAGTTTSGVTPGAHVAAALAPLWELGSGGRLQIETGLASEAQDAVAAILLAIGAEPGAAPPTYATKSLVADRLASASKSDIASSTLNALHSNVLSAVQAQQQNVAENTALYGFDWWA
ncbi:MAG: hypothetical protein KDA41_00135, partial [Planctomycetales bacterium]|nr:hypothetical protein [Planctomycetales bacterium]